MNGRTVAIGLALALCVAGMPPAGDAASAKKEPARPGQAKRPVERITRTEAEWKKLLTPEQFRVLRKEGTEVAFTGKYWNHHADGVYRCAACGLALFGSDTKFDSGTGWPSYWAPFAKEHVQEVVDGSHGMERIEVECARCGGHLGHVFDDGPRPTGLRYCINSAALTFAAKQK